MFLVTIRRSNFLSCPYCVFLNNNGIIKYAIKLTYAST